MLEPLNIRRNVFTWVLLALGFTTTACGDDLLCTLEIRTAVRGSVYSADGQAVIADRVILSNEQTDQECEIHLATEEGDEPSYSCIEMIEGAATLNVFVGQQILVRDVKLESDGCHVRALRVDVHLAPEADD